MKKLTALLLSICAAVCVVAFAACGSESYYETVGDTTVETTETTVAFTVDKNYYPALDDSTSVYDYLLVLESDGKLTFTTTLSSTGAYITSINGLAEDTSTYSYWLYYSNVANTAECTYSSTEYTYTYNNVAYYSANYGVSGMPAIDGCTYVFVYQTF